MTLNGGTRTPNTFVTVTADTNFNGVIEGGDLSLERGVLSSPGIDGRFRYIFSLPDDGPWPGNGTSSDKLTIRAGYGTAVKSFELTVRNVAPRIIGTPSFSIGKDASGTPVARVIVTIADVGIHDNHTVKVKWSDGNSNSTLYFLNTNNTCGPGADRIVTVERRLAPGMSVYPVEVLVTDDDLSPAAGDDETAVFRMFRLDGKRSRAGLRNFWKLI